MKNFLKIFFLLLCYAQNTSSQEIINAHKITNSISIDGMLEEQEWEAAEALNNFTTWQPNFGDDPDMGAEVRIIYDDEAIYIGARIEEIHRDSIMTQLSQRDDIGNTDWFGVILDTYGNGNDALEFILGATGVQFDAKVTNTNGEDTDWDGIWFSNVHLTNEGWTLEMKIPYASLRFPNKEVQEWNVNFFKMQARTGEKSTWFPIDPAGPGFLTQMGKLQGIRDIKPPLRLSFSPYVSSYVQHSHDKNRTPINSTGMSYNGGMDVKYGINDAFTLDMTLIPDFGQVQSDDQVLNLSPFEIQFNENRPFFTEGIEIFSKGNLFYSRRIGGRPIAYYNAYQNLSENEEVVSNPTDAQLYNATKVSGRTNNGLGIGVFNAVGGSSEAIVKDRETGKERRVQTGPLTNYSVIVLDQNLPNNSFFALVNTNVWRKGDEFYNANVSAVNFDIKNKNQSYGIDGSFAVSQLYFPSSDDIFGYRYDVGISKLKGNFNYYLYNEATSKSFDNNDLGFTRQTNIMSSGVSMSYGVYEPWFKFSRGNVWFNYSYDRLMNPSNYIASHFNTGFWFQGKNLWNYNLWANYRPSSKDFFEPRSEGRHYNMVPYYNTGIWVGTDNRKKLRFNSSIFGYNTTDEGRQGYNFNVGVRYRFNDKLSSSINASINQEYNAEGWVNSSGEGEIFFGQRDQQTNNNTLRIDYNINDKMGFNIRARHYWSKVVYSNFYELEQSGELSNSDYNEFHDLSFNLLNIDLNYRWRFAPGSDLFINWKNNIAGGQYSDQINYRNLSYADGLKNLSEYEQNNSFSFRLVYYIDYQNMQKWF